MTSRILFVAPFGLGQKTTVWARTLPLARGLVARGHQVTIVIPPWDTPADSGRAWVDGGVAVVNVRLGGGLSAILWRMMRVINQAQPDLVHIVKPRAHAGLVQWLLWQRRRLTGRGPLILLDVDDWEQAWAAINHYPPLVARFLAWQEEWGIRHADAVTAASHWLVARVKRYTPGMPVLYLPNGITAPLPSVADLRIVKRGEKEQIFFFSRYVEVSPAWLAAFWGALHEQLPSATLVVFGDALQADRPATFQQAMQAHNPAAATQVSWQPYAADAVEGLYAQSSCAIFPSDQSPLHEAKCSVRLATTLLRGVPVVASAVGEQQFYGAEGAAALVPAGATPAAFAQAVVEVLKHPQARLLQQANAEERLLWDYDWDKLAGQLAEFYEKQILRQG